MVVTWQQRTFIFGGAGDLAEELDEVGQVVAEELGFEHQVLARVPCGQGGAEELGFADDAQGGAAVGALDAN